MSTREQPGPKQANHGLGARAAQQAHAGFRGRAGTALRVVAMADRGAHAGDRHDGDR